MCQFVSWIEKNGRVYFLSDKELATRAGKELIKFCGSGVDLLGHGAIREYNELVGGTNRECSDFSKTSNFPKEIVEMVRNGRFRMLEVIPLELLSQLAWEKYDRVRKSAWEEYEKVGKVERFAWKEYKEVERSAFWKLFSIRSNRLEIWR